MLLRMKSKKDRYEKRVLNKQRIFNAKEKQTLKSGDMKLEEITNKWKFNSWQTVYFKYSLLFLLDRNWGENVENADEHDL